MLSRHKHHQGYKLTETLSFQRDKDLVNTRHQRESVLLLDGENRRRGPSVIYNAIISKPASRKPTLGTPIRNSGSDFSDDLSERVRSPHRSPRYSTDLS